MKKRKTSLAFVLFALGATPLMATGCGGDGGTGDNLVEKTCGSCGEKVPHDFFKSFTMDIFNDFYFWSNRFSSHFTSPPR